MDQKAAFIASLNEYRALIYKVASIYTNSAEDRNDLVQEIVFQLWKSYPGFQARAHISTWMYRVAMNVALHHLKVSRRAIQTVPLEEYNILHPAAENNPQEEQWQLIKKHVEQLNLLDKGIVLLYLENKSHEEIAQVVGISVSNVGTRLSRIKEKLRQQILK